jgi:hypothetical protein
MGSLAQRSSFHTLSPGRTKSRPVGDRLGIRAAFALSGYLFLSAALLTHLIMRGPISMPEEEAVEDLESEGPREGPSLTSRRKPHRLIPPC